MEVSIQNHKPIILSQSLSENPATFSGNHQHPLETTATLIKNSYSSSHLQRNSKLQKTQNEETAKTQKERKKEKREREEEEEMEMQAQDLTASHCG